jgi:hypothetical protein
MGTGFYITFIFMVMFIGTLGFFIAMRYIGYRETMNLAEKGLVRPDRTASGSGNGKDTLRWGIVITAVGLALCVGLYPIGLLPGSSFPLGIGPWMIAGWLPTFFGLGLILIYVLTHDDKDDRPSSESKGEPKPPMQ